MKSLRSHEGYMMIDNRNSEGIPDGLVVASGLPVGAGHGLYESATYTCAHCQSIVVIEPKRTRERAFCTSCAQRICDACGIIRSKTMECKTFVQMIDELQEADLKRNISPSILLQP